MKSISAIIIALTILAPHLKAQSDSTHTNSNQPPGYQARNALYMAKLNQSGNLMICTAVGLAAAGSFLVYEGVQTYNTPAPPVSANPANDIQQNHSHGTAYIAAGSVAFAGAAILIGLGIKNKIEFKQRRKLMSLQSGLLDTGHLGFALAFQ